MIYGTKQELHSGNIKRVQRNRREKHHILFSTSISHEFPYFNFLKTKFYKIIGSNGTFWRSWCKYCYYMLHSEVHIYLLGLCVLYRARTSIWCGVTPSQQSKAGWNVRRNSSMNWESVILNFRMWARPVEERHDTRYYGLDQCSEGPSPARRDVAHIAVKSK